MKKTLHSEIIRIASGFPDYWISKIKDNFDIQCYPKEPEYELESPILRQTFFILSLMPISYVKKCGIKKLYFSNAMGPNKTYYPNHGYFVDDLVTLNVDIFNHPDVCPDFFDHNGYFMDRPTQTLLHEFAHGYDQYNGNLSLKKDWLQLSNWSETAKPGLKKLIIQEPGVPKMVGEWFYNPKAGFTRFYGKKNPWDDWADCCAFFTGKMKTKVPDTKRDYFEQRLHKFYN